MAQFEFASFDARVSIRASPNAAYDGHKPVKCRVGKYKKRGVRMSYEVFKMRIESLIERAGGGIRVGFYTEPDIGKHYANCSDGTVIVGDENKLSVSVFWNGKAHSAVATI